MSRPATTQKLNGAVTLGRLLVGGLTLAATAIALGVFATIYTKNYGSDFDPHSQMTLDAIRTGSFEGNFLYYLVNAAAAGFSENLRLIRGASAAILAAAVGAKFFVSWRFAQHELTLGRRVDARALLIAAPTAVWLLLFVFSFPTHTAYLGQLPANVWHNSTTIFLMPFALWLFVATLAYLRTGAPRLLWQILAAGALNVAVKPSFAMVTLAIFPLACLMGFGFDARLRRALYVCAGIAALIGVQYLYIFGTQTHRPDSGVKIDPFHVWSQYSADVPVSLLASLVFPLTALLVYRQRLWRMDYVRYALALAAAAVVMFILLAETGPGELDGNFSWQAIVCMYVLFLCTLVGVLRIWFTSPERRELLPGVLVAAAFLGQVVAGVVYLAHYNSVGTFL